jgi:hypothetical protein
MDTLIVSISNFFSSLMGMVSKAGFGPTGAIAWSAIFIGIGVARLLWSFQQYRSDDFGGSFITFLKTSGKMALIWFLIAGSPWIFGGIASFVQGNVQNAAQGPITQQAQGLFNTLSQDVKVLWWMEPVAEREIFDTMPAQVKSMTPTAFQPSATGALVGGAKAAVLINQMSDTWTQNSLTQSAQAKRMLASSNPKVRIAGQQLMANAVLQAQATGQAAMNLGTMAQQVAPAAQAEQNASGDGSSLSLVPMLDGLNAIMGIIVMLTCTAGGILVVGPSLVLAVTALLKVISSAIEIFTYLFGFAAMVVVVSGFAVVLGPLAMFSFFSEHWSKYGWNFVSFWIQALVASIAVVVMTSILGTAFGSLGGFMSQAAILVAGAAASKGTGPLDMALQALMGGVLFLGMGLALSYLSSFLQKALSGTTAMVHGSLHP